MIALLCGEPTSAKPRMQSYLQCQARHRKARLPPGLPSSPLVFFLFLAGGWLFLGEDRPRAGTAASDGQDSAETSQNVGQMLPEAERARQFRGHIERAAQCFQQADTACALDGYDNAYQLNPQPLLLFNMAQIYRKTGRVESALDYYKRFLREAPQSELSAEVREYVSALQENMRGGQAKSAASLSRPPRPADNFTGSEEKRQELFRLHIDRGSSYFKSADYDRAISEYWLAYELRPQSIIVFNVAQAYRKAQRWVEAKTLYERYLREEPHSPLAGELEGYITEAQERLRAQQLNSENNATRRLVLASSALAERMAELREIEKQIAAQRLAAAGGEPARPIYRRAWFWCLIGGAAAGIALGVGLGVGLQPKLPDADFGKVMLSF